MGFSGQERHGATGVGPVDGNKDDQGIGPHLLSGKDEGAGPVQPPEEVTVSI